MKWPSLLLLSLMFFPLGCKTSSSSEETEKTITQLTRKAEKGDVRAQLKLGRVYTKLWNFPEANHWYRIAAEQGSADAQYALGHNYETGEGVSKDLIEAYAWFNLAAAQDNRLAMNARDKVSHSMTHHDIEEGNRRSNEYLMKGAVPESVRKKLSISATNQPAPTTVTPPAE